MASPLDTCDEDEFWLSGHEVGTGLLGLSRHADLLAVCISILLDVLLGTLEDDAALLLVGLIRGSVADPGTEVFNAWLIGSASVPKDG